MTDREQALAELDIYGFTVVPDVLDAGRVAAMKEALVRCEREAGTDHRHRGAARHVANLPTLDPVFFSCLDHPKVLPLLVHYLGDTLILGSLNARIVRPGDGDQGLHSDIGADLLNMASPVMMNTVWMLDDFSAENGGTRVVPGSHRSGLQEPPEGFRVRHVHQSQAPAGSVLVFNGQCWHGGGARPGGTRCSATTASTSCASRDGGTRCSAITASTSCASRWTRTRDYLPGGVAAAAQRPLSEAPAAHAQRRGRPPLGRLPPLRRWRAGYTVGDELSAVSAANRSKKSGKVLAAQPGSRMVRPGTRRPVTANAIAMRWSS